MRLELDDEKVLEFIKRTVFFTELKLNTDKLPSRANSLRGGGYKISQFQNSVLTSKLR